VSDADRGGSSRRPGGDLLAPATPPTATVRTRQSRRAGWRRLLRALVGAALLLVLGLVALVTVVYVRTDIPTPNSVVTGQTTVITYADGREIGRIGALNRRSVPLDTVPADVRHAVLAAEDRHYYSEPGISPRGIARAVWVNLRGGNATQGGSTITQQYAKNAYLTSSKTFSRKFREIFIAVKLDRSRSKDRVFEDYLNSIYFGRGAYGIQTAAETYFHTTVDRLNASQGAVLASLIRAPAFYDPTAHQTAARDRWRYVLDGMVAERWLTRSEAAALGYPEVARDKPRNAMGGPNGYLIEAVKKELTARGFDENRLNAGGLTVRTTINRKAQAAAVAAENEVLGKVPGPVSALVAVEPGVGAVRAMYGGRDYTGKGRTAQLNLATQIERLPGSSFKPYTLATALKQGISLRTVYDGSSPKFVKNYGKNDMVRNDDGEQCRRCDLVTALERSVNTVFVPLAIDVGPRAVAATAHAAGIPAAVRLGDPRGYTAAGITLGVYGVHPIDQAVGFATFAARGIRAEPFLVEGVTDRDGHQLYRAKPATAGAFTADVAADATYAMRQVIEGPEGTAQRARLAGNRPAAGKTGTTSENKDAWFVGFTPQLSAAVWIGNEDNAPLTNVPGYTGGVYGGSLPAEIWRRFMDGALAGDKVLDFPPPTYLGSSSGGLPSAPPSRVRTVAPSSAAASPAVLSPAPSRSSPTPPASPSPRPSPSPSPVPSSPPPPPPSSPPPPPPPSSPPPPPSSPPPTSAPPASGSP